MTKSIPLNSLNSIATVAFAVNFDREFTPEEEQRLVALREVLALELPFFSQEMRFETKFENNQIVDPRMRPAGVKLQRIEPNGQTGWMLQVVANQIIVSCNVYDRWDTVSAKADKYIQAALTFLDVASLNVQSLTLQYVDQFIGSKEGYSVYDVFDKKTRYLTPFIVEAGALWHVHQGWFEEIKKAERILHVLNVGSLQNEDKIITSIDHAGHFQFAEKPHPAKQLFNSKSEYREIYDTLHHKNKDVMKLLLNEKQKKAIKLNG